jgi:hypothetical protein
LVAAGDDVSKTIGSALLVLFGGMSRSVPRTDAMKRYPGEPEFRQTGVSAESPRLPDLIDGFIEAIVKVSEGVV